MEPGFRAYIYIYIYMYIGFLGMQTLVYFPYLSDYSPDTRVHFVCPKTDKQFLKPLQKS